MTSENAWSPFAYTRLLGNAAALAVYADDGGQSITLPVRPMMVVNPRRQFVLTNTTPIKAKAQAVEDVATAVIQGAIVGTEAT